MFRSWHALPFVLFALSAASARAADGNRLAYLDGTSLYHPSRDFPKLVTPQWVGEEGVEAVVVLAIDDMRGHQKWEAYLRPILNRLKRIDGRAPVSIMTCRIDPKEKHLQKWLKEGVSLETHTFDHPCPILQKGDLKKAKATFDKAVDLLAAVPNSKPVAFRTPCCDSLNTPSPRLFAEIFNKTTPLTPFPSPPGGEGKGVRGGNFLTIDSSVFNVFTPNDPDLPRELVLEDGKSRFAKYLPRDRTFVNTIADYPYPYVIGRLCWEFPCVTPSDWSAQHLHGVNNPLTVRDWKAALDATVIKRGVFCLVFHPHGWIKAEQIIDLIDHAQKKHGKKVKFLTFRECQERIDKHLLAGHPLRHPKTGEDNGVRLLDVNNDGYMDVNIDDGKTRQLRKWVPANGGSWKVEDLTGAPRPPFLPPGAERYHVLRRVKLGNDGVYVASDGKEQEVFVKERGRYVRARFALPPGARLGDGDTDHGLRFVDINEDGKLDVIFSNEKEYGIYLFTDMKRGWSRKVMAGKAGDKGALPLISRGGTNNGFFVHSRSLWWQNEDTGGLLKDHLNRRSFNDLLKGLQPGPKSPQASLRCLKPRPGFVAELVAAEPLVMDPVAFAWGPDGKFWVVEMGDYPLGVPASGGRKAPDPGGRVRFLEDSDGDGKYDKSTIFLDNLGYPTGVLPWREGVLVTCAPDILYAEDTDGDGKADKRTALFTGFGEGNQQHRVNTLAWGLDNWVYVANGDSGGNIKSAKTGQAVNISGRDLRIRPDTGAIETVTGKTQFGRSRDDWGNWFGGNNSNPLWHFVLADHYLRRNPHVAPPPVRVSVPRVAGNAPVFPISRTLERFNDFHTANRFTSACSPIVYRDELFGPPGADAPGSPSWVFVSEPVHNLVHREIMSPNGVTFTSRRTEDEQQSEFLASSDNWFRPTMIATGPDGALWVADMYRHVIEHPQWIPKEWQERLDLRAGHDRGRIYRVYPVGAKPRAVPRLDKLDTAGLVAALDSPNGWQRDTAQQMLLWRKDKDAVPLLEKLASESKRPLARLHALCTLDGLDALKPDLLKQALADTEPGLRRHAARLCEPRLPQSEDLGEELLKLIDDPDPQVRLQLAYTLGEWDSPKAGEALGRLAVKVKDDPYLTAAVLSSVNKKNLDAVLLAVLKASEGDDPPRKLLACLLRLADALGHKKATVTLLNAVATPEKGAYQPWQLAALDNFLDGLEQRGSSLERVAKSGDADMRAAVKKLEGLFDLARDTAANARKVSPEALAEALPLLGRGTVGQKEDIAVLAQFLTPQTPKNVRSAAVAALGRLRMPEAADALLRGWGGYGPTLRSRVLEHLFRREATLKQVLAAVEKKQVRPTEIDAARRQRLLEHKDTAIRARAAKLFAGSIDADRQKVIDTFKGVRTLKGDVGRGLMAFTKHCAACHKLGDVGKAVGPDLAALTDKSTEALLAAVLDPNRAVESKYVNYLAETKSGQTFSGLITTETGSSITLVGPDGKEQVLLRTNLESLGSTGKSAMPEGLEKEIQARDLADLFAFLRSARPPEKK